MYSLHIAQAAHCTGRREKIRMIRIDKNRHDYNTLPSLRGKMKNVLAAHNTYSGYQGKSVHIIGLLRYLHSISYYLGASLDNVCSRLYWAGIYDDTEVSLCSAVQAETVV